MSSALRAGSLPEFKGGMPTLPSLATLLVEAAESGNGGLLRERSLVSLDGEGVSRLRERALFKGSGVEGVSGVSEHCDPVLPSNTAAFPALGDRKLDVSGVGLRILGRSGWFRNLALGKRGRAPTASAVETAAGFWWKEKKAPCQ